MKNFRPALDTANSPGWLNPFHGIESGVEREAQVEKPNFMKIFYTLIAFFVICIGAKAQSCTNFYAASEIEIMAGPAFSFAHPVTRMSTGTELGGTYWQSIHYGGGIRAGVTSFSHLNALLFDYSQVDYNVRWPFWRFAIGGRLGAGKDFTDGSNYTVVDATLEFRLTKNMGIETEAGDKFCATDKAGLLGAVQATISF